MTPSAPPSAISADADQSHRVHDADCGRLGAETEKLRNCLRNTSTVTSATTRKRASALPSSISPRIENIRPSPATGSSRLKSGTSAWLLKVQPPISSGASTAAASSSASSGAAASSALRRRVLEARQHALASSQHRCATA